MPGERAEDNRKAGYKTRGKAGTKGITECEEGKVCFYGRRTSKEIEAAGKLLDSVITELKVKRISPTEELQKDLGLLEKAVADRER